MSDSNADILVSIVMPAYNEEQHIEESLQSFFGQSIAEQCELICVNDGSTDATPYILERWSQDHPENLVILNQDNLGSGPARNAAMRNARGSYIGFLDSDDLYPSHDVLERLANAFTASQCDIVGGSLITFNDEVESSDFAHVDGFEGHQFLEESVVEYRDYQFDYGYQRFLYNRTFLEENGLRFPDYLRYQDPPFFVAAMIAAERFYAIVAPTYKYRAIAGAVHWSEEKLHHMLQAMKDVARMAADNSLERLFALNLRRFDVDNLPSFRSIVFDQADLEMLAPISEARKEMVRIGEEAGFTIDAAPETPIEKDVHTALKRYFSLCDDLANADAVIVELEARLQDREAELARVYESTSWKTGRLVTSAPRYVKSKLRP